jgi:hypothetical protein
MNKLKHTLLYLKNNKTNIFLNTKTSLIIFSPFIMLSGIFYFYNK